MTATEAGVKNLSRADRSEAAVLFNAGDAIFSLAPWLFVLAFDVADFVKNRTTTDRGPQYDEELANKF